MSDGSAERVAALEERLRVLFEVTRAFAEATTDTERLLQTVAVKLAETVRDACSVLLLSEDGSTLVPVALHHADEKVAEVARNALADEPLVVEHHPIPRRVLRTGVAFLGAKIGLDTLRPPATTPHYYEFARKTGLHSILVVPLRLRESSLGILTLTRHGTGSPSFEAFDLELAQNLADHAALAIANSRSYAAERAAKAAAEEARRALENADIRFSRLSEAGIIGIIVTGMTAGVVEINDALLSMVGYGREEILSGAVPWRDLTPPEWNSLDEIAVTELSTKGVATLREKEYFKKDGSRLPVLVGSAMLPRSTGLAISFVLDVSERKSAEARVEELRKERGTDALFKSLLEAAPDAMLISDVGGAIQLVNAQAERLFGYPREELLGKPFEMVIADADRATYAEHVVGYFGHSVVPNHGLGLDLNAQSKNGHDFPVEIRLSPIVDGENVLVASAVRDITERLKAEEALQIANKELESFSYSVAHDLRAPLRGIHGFSQILLEDYGQKLDVEGADCLREIQTNAARMAALIDALLLLSRVTRSELVPSRTDLSAIAADIASAHVSPESDRKVEVVIAERVFGMVDPRLARILLENLIGNAFKFTSKTPNPRIEFGIKEARAGTSFFVRDNGAGFDEKFANHLFSPFQRLHSVAEFPGTGIGLATVKRIVTRHGGRIWSEGKVGRGATFSFTLPDDS